jgi:2-C-methyl-D-erythritol 2,4-cyclodiphosphate synthase
VNFDPVYEYRTGIGTDIHRIVEGRPLMLGGIQVPFSMGLLGHSDGDVALHAVIDAMIGAAGMGDIGTLFPDTDESFRDIDSKELLTIVRDQLKEKSWEVVNIDLIIHTEQPRLGPYKGQMRRAISGIMGIDFAVVNIKAKTNEGLGEIGNGLAMAATANVLLRRRIKRTI